jgi:hypothetical protein
MVATTTDRARRAGVARFLREFAAARPGLRSGVMFGMPAVYAGRRLVAFASRDGIVCRLPADEVRVPGVRARPFVMKDRRSRGWTMLRASAPRHLRQVALVIEMATMNALKAAPERSRARRRG